MHSHLEDNTGYVHANFAYGGRGAFVSLGALERFGRQSIEHCKKFVVCMNMDFRLGACLVCFYSAP